MSNIGEFGLIERISAQFRDNRLSTGGVLGIGDHCAVLPQREGLDTLVTTDLLIEDRHFLLGDISPWQLGWKSAAVNISDIAAMGGRPEGAFLSIALPKELPTREGPSPLSDWVDAFIGGFKALSGRFGVPLLGGDTSASPDKLFINVTVLGSCPHGAAILRSGARVGDLICVTGTLGDAAAGLKLILERACAAPGGSFGAAPALIRRHYEPVPRVAEGIALRECGGVHSMMDISDGIASDLRHILKASGGGQPLGAVIDLGNLPLSDELRLLCSERGWDPYELAVSGGEDYELLFTLGPEALDKARQAVGELSVIGRITEGPDIRWEGGLQQDYQGFTHF
ncbi:MAG: thiamine-phosphate kinase [Bacteroidales bacterium]|nr:thiamine-phosphate kinase [Bacteroidales bacterium]